MGQVKSIIHNFQKMNKDLTKSKTPVQFYYDAHNIRFITNNEVTTGAFSFEKGNELVVTIPNPIINSSAKTITYNSTTLNYTNTEIDALDNVVPSGPTRLNQIILGHSVVRDNVILFTTDNNGLDCIWKINDENYNITLLYIRNLNFSTSNPIQTVDNFENQNIDKVYWVDNKSQMRFLNIYHSILNSDLEDLIDLPQNAIEMVGKYDLSQPKIIDILSGGIHTAGMIQYAYNLYRINSSQTKLSPLSELIDLDKDKLGGGELNEIVSQIPVVSIKNIDKNFSHIRVYAIKYTSFNQVPSISLIEEKEIPSTHEIEVFDDGNIISTVSLEEFLFLGSDIIIPKNINSKHGRMFFAGYREIAFDVDRDMRAYSFNSSGVARVYDNLFINAGVIDGTSFDVDGTNYDDILLNKHDSVNLDYDYKIYEVDGLTRGGEGKYIKYELTQDTDKTEDSKFFKDDEIYRLGFEFFNAYGQVSLPKWVADFRAPSGNLKGLYNTLRVILQPEFYIWLNNPSNFQNDYDIPTGYRVLIAERGINDKTIVANGLLSTMMVNNKIPNRSDDINYKRGISETLPKTPTFFIRNLNSGSNGVDNNLAITNVIPIRNAWHMHRLDFNWTAYSEVFVGNVHIAEFYQFNSMLQLWSPEIIFNQNVGLTSGLKLRIKGALKNTYNASWGTELDIQAFSNKTEGKMYNGVSPAFTPYVQPIIGNIYNLFDRGLIGHPGGDENQVQAVDQYYRVYGNLDVNTNTPTGSIITLNNVFSPTVSNVNKINLDQDVNVILNPNNNDATVDLEYKAIITYTITPDIGYTSVNYSASILSDPLGTEYTNLTNVTGTQTITYTKIYTVSVSQVDNTLPLDFYLRIDPDNNFNAQIDVQVDYIETQTITPFAITTNDTTNSDNNSITLIATPVISNPGYIVDPINPVTVDIYGTPEIVEKGQDYTSYNNDSKYRYFNSLQAIITDGDDSYADDGACSRSIISINSWANKNITFVTGDDNSTQPHWQRPTLEQIFIDTGISGNNYGLIGELVKSDEEIYLGNIYGGNTYEDKKRSNYIEIGSYQDINNNIIDIKSPGDTFVHNFKFERIGKTDVANINECVQQVTEIVNFTTETTIDLKNRDDLSLQSWDAKFQPKFEDYHKYNTVYSQQPNLFLRRDLNFNFKKVTRFDTNVIASKVKIPGELIDNWTDIQQNEILTLDGKFGPINALISSRDNLFTFQDKGIAFLSINPRVQVQGDDGLQLQLGVGAVLSEYKYITSNSGSINKWAIQPTEGGIYYLDGLNKSFNMITADGVTGLSDKEGFHKWFLDNININTLKVDNPILYSGASIGWDKITNDIYLSIFDTTHNKITLSYNLVQGGFSSFYDYNSSMYIHTRSKTLTVNPGNNATLFQNFAGEYNIFYNQNKLSKIAFSVNPEPITECTFNNLEYNAVALNSDNYSEIKNYTWERIRAYNEFQDSGLRNLVLSSNIRKLNRNWRLAIPRDNNKVNRIRNTWTIIELEANNINNYLYTNQDITTMYSPTYKAFI